MNIRIYNVNVLKLDSKNTWVLLSDMEVWIKNSFITNIFRYKNNGKISLKWDREIDGKGNILMPGFKNAHTHSAMTFLRSYADCSKLQDWLNDYIFPAEKKLTEEIVYWGTILAIMEYLSGGITANFDMYFHPKIIAKASVCTGFRTVQTSAFSNFYSSISEMEELYHTVNELSDLTSFMVGFHAEYSTSKQLLTNLAKLSNKLKSPVWFHNAETKQEVIECKKRWGVTPTKLTYELGLFEYGGGGYHCVWVEDSDIEIMKAKKITAVINPASNIKLCSGIAPVNKFLENGIQVALGTDGAASNNSLNMFKEMYLAATLDNFSRNDPSCIKPEQILYMATKVGADSMGLDYCDNLEVGKKADLVLLDIYQPNMQPVNKIINNIVYSGSKNNVLLTIVNGEILYENGEYHIGIEPEDVYSKLALLLKEIRE